MDKETIDYKYIQRKGHEEVDLYVDFKIDKNDVSFHPPPKLNEIDDKPLPLLSPSFLKKRLSQWLKDVFLPQGYPYSVSSDYLQYQIWDSLQAYCSNLAGALSLHSTLVSIGVGQDSATPLTAAISWLTKDGAGMISSITFAYYKGCELDFNSKQWRLFADIANDGAHFIRLLAPVLPLPFLFIFCCSSIMSSLVGVAGGATRASLIQHQALCNNMADVSAKDGSQETLVNLAGLITSLTLLPILTSNPVITWTMFILFVCLHLYTNFKAMRSIQMRTLNRPRLLLIFDAFYHSSLVPDVVSTNKNEPLFSGPAFINNYLTRDFRLEAGVSLNYVLKKFKKDEEQFKKLFLLQLKDFDDRKYMVFASNDSGVIYVIYHNEVKNIDVVESFWGAYSYAKSKEKIKEDLPSEMKVTSGDLIKALDSFRSSFELFTPRLIEKGWQLDPLRLNIGEWRLMNKKYD